MARPGCACTQGGCGRTIERGRGNLAAAGWEHSFAGRCGGGSGGDRLSGWAQAARGGGRWSSPGDRSTRPPRRYRSGVSPGPPPRAERRWRGAAARSAPSPAALASPGSLPAPSPPRLPAGWGADRPSPPRWGCAAGAAAPRRAQPCALPRVAALRWRGPAGSRAPPPRARGRPRGAAGSACVGHLPCTAVCPCPLCSPGFRGLRGRERTGEGEGFLGGASGGPRSP